MKRYNVTGMSCAACSARVEKAVSKLESVDQVSVNLLTNSMLVEGTASDDEIIKAVVDAGYGASADVKKQQTVDKSNNEDNASTSNDEERKLRNRLLISLALLLPLMYVSMGHMLWDFPLPERFVNNHIAMGLYELLLTTLIMVINQRFFVSGFTSLAHRAPNMDTLVALGATASYGYSVYALFAMSDAMVNGSMSSVEKYMDEFYFESAATILTLITLGKMLEARSKGKTTDALKSLMKLAPKKATIIVDGEYEEVDIAKVKIGDVFAVKAGESIPVDGIIIYGSAAVDESALTGESIPVDKSEGDTVSAGTINMSDYVECEATRVGEDTTLAKIIQMVSDSAATKAPIAKIADKVSGVFVPIVICLSFITLLIWLLVGKSIGFSLAMGISVLVISCPCALGLATPVAIMVGNGVGAKNGILFKTSTALEETGKIDVIAFDKTGTITRGTPEVTDVIPVGEISEKELIELANWLESFSEHPLARAVVNYYKTSYKTDDESIKYSITEYETFPGNGVMAFIKGKKAYAGNITFMERFMNKQYIEEHLPKEMVDKLSGEGKTSIFIGSDDEDGNGSLLGIIAISDVIRDESIVAINNLKSMGIHVIMLTGDNEKTARTIGNQVGVDEVIAGVLPDGKEKVIRELKAKYKKVAMVGDGINDAPALTTADVGIAIGAGTDIAIDSADVVLMKSNTLDVVRAIKLSKATIKNIHQNLFWAFCYNVIGIPLAAGVWYPLFGIKLNPMFGAAAMSLSSFCVVTNALRLNLTKLNVDLNWGQTPIKTNEKSNNKGEEKMEKKMTIEGMMCGHCEARVKKTLEAIDGVSEAIVSHENNSAIVKLTAEVSNDTLKEAVEAQDYKVVAID